MELTKLNYTVDNRIAVIEMNDPKTLNAIDGRMAEELEFAFDQAKQDPQVSVIVYKGAGKAFSAGGDLGYFYKLFSCDRPDLAPLCDQLARVGRIIHDMKRMDKLIISEVTGSAAGGGANMALSGDFVLCADNAVFLQAFVNIGLAPDTGGAFLLSRSIGASRAMELCATGRPLKADEALSLGLVYQVYPKDQLHGAVMRFAEKLVKGPAVAYRGIKRQIYAANYLDYKRFLEESEGPTQREAFQTEDFREGIRAFVEKRPPSYRGR